MTGGGDGIVGGVIVDEVGVGGDALDLGTVACGNCFGGLWQLGTIGWWSGAVGVTCVVECCGVPSSFKSSAMVRGSESLCIGVNFLKNLRLRSVGRRDPSVLTVY